MGVLNSAERQEAEHFSRLTWCNPFTPERQELERALLGKRYREPDMGAVGSISANMDLLLPKLSNLLDKVRTRVAKAHPAERDLHLYRDLILFHLYHCGLGDMVEYVRVAHADGKSRANATAIYRRFCREMERFELGGVDWFGYTKSHLFACFFQVVCAYYHIINGLVGASSGINRLRARVWQSIFTVNMERYQRCLYNRMGDVITLVCGPSGTGKEIVSRAIGRSRFIPFDEKAGAFAEDFMSAFYAINLSALSPTLIESELFGHRKGAFTGALVDREGYFAACGSYGTVFLDEIGEVDTAIQVKLLRVLQTRQYQRLGDTGTEVFKGKVMAATNRDLAEEINAGRFREDFYYRLCADKVETLPLKDILSEDERELDRLVLFVLKKVLGDEEGARMLDEVMATILRAPGRDYSWPGNFRELEQCVRNIVIHGEYLPEQRRGSASEDSIQHSVLNLADQGLPVNRLLSRYVSAVYNKNTNYEATARLLGLDRRTVKKYVEQPDP